jgi:hypothetical protein
LNRLLMHTVYPHLPLALQLHRRVVVLAQPEGMFVVTKFQGFSIRVFKLGAHRHHGRVGAVFVTEKCQYFGPRVLRNYSGQSANVGAWIRKSPYGRTCTPELWFSRKPPTLVTPAGLPKPRRFPLRLGTPPNPNRFRRFPETGGTRFLRFASRSPLLCATPGTRTHSARVPAPPSPADPRSRGTSMPVRLDFVHSQTQRRENRA